MKVNIKINVAIEGNYRHEGGNINGSKVIFNHDDFSGRKTGNNSHFHRKYFHPRMAEFVNKIEYNDHKYQPNGKLRG